MIEKAQVVNVGMVEGSSSTGSAENEDVKVIATTIAKLSNEDNTEDISYPRRRVVRMVMKRGTLL